MKIRKTKIFYTLLVLLLSVNIIFTSFSPLFIYAQEEYLTSPSPTPESQDASSPTPQPEPSQAPEPTLEPSVSPTPTPFDPYNHPPYSSKEYDAWKEQYDIWKVEQQKEDDLKELQEEEAKQKKLEEKQETNIREDEWEIHDEDLLWQQTHGDDEDYFVSGSWEKDQEALALAAREENTPGDNSNNSLTQVPPPQSCPTIKSSDSAGPEAILGDPSTDSADTNSFSNSSQTVDVNNDNCLSMGNGSDTSSSSGENTQVNNDGSVTTSTGGSSSEGRLVNNGNENVVSVDDANLTKASANDSFTTGSDSENLNTGEDTTNLSQGSETNNLSVDNNNQAYVNNQMNVEATSGSNTLTNNDGSASLTTGDLNLIANMLNILNLNITGDDFLHLIVNIFGTLNGNLNLDDIALALGYKDDNDLEVIARNENVGDNSVNEAEAKKEENINIDNSNEAQVNNDLQVTGVSGGNDVSKNDGEVSVITGRIQILANLMNFINTNFSGEKWNFYMVNIFGSLLGDIILPDTKSYLEGVGGQVLAENTGAGDGSTSTSNATNIENTAVTNSNGVTLSNNISATGTSGLNDQSDNDGPADGQMGNVDVSSNILNFLNLNITGNNWVFLIVNVFGKWMGQIVGFAGASPFGAPQNGTFAALSVGDNGSNNNQISDKSLNSGGEDSTNTATASLTRDTNVNDANTATVNNNMEVNGLSGENKLNTNDGRTTLRTGWVDIDANLLNIINMNVTGRSWMMVFLNVFGDFVGNLFFGKPPEPPKPLLANIDFPSLPSSQAASLAITNGGNTPQNNSQSNDSSTSQAPGFPILTSTSLLGKSKKISKSLKILSSSVFYANNKDALDVYLEDFKFGDIMTNTVYNYNSAFDNNFEKRLGFLIEKLNSLLNEILSRFNIIIPLSSAKIAAKFSLPL